MVPHQACQICTFKDPSIYKNKETGYSGWNVVSVNPRKACYASSSLHNRRVLWRAIAECCRENDLRQEVGERGKCDKGGGCQVKR